MFRLPFPVVGRVQMHVHVKFNFCAANSILKIGYAFALLAIDSYDSHCMSVGFIGLIRKTFFFKYPWMVGSVDLIRNELF